jgi:hypothetical protein
MSHPRRWAGRLLACWDAHSGSSNYLWNGCKQEEDDSWSLVCFTAMNMALNGATLRYSIVAGMNGSQTSWSLVQLFAVFLLVVHIMTFCSA